MSDTTPRKGERCVNACDLCTLKNIFKLDRALRVLMLLSVCLLATTSVSVRKREREKKQLKAVLFWKAPNRKFFNFDFVGYTQKLPRRGSAAIDSASRLFPFC